MAALAVSSATAVGRADAAGAAAAAASAFAAGPAGAAIVEHAQRAPLGIHQKKAFSPLPRYADL